MDAVGKNIAAAFTLLLLTGPGCVSVEPEPESAPGVGLGGVFREVHLADGSVQSSGLVVGPYRVSLGGTEFRLLLEPGGELGPEEFDLVRFSGLGSPRLECGLVGRRVPLELILLFDTRLDGPRFEKRIRMRWLGPSDQAPLLVRVVLEELPLAAAGAAAGAGRPAFLEGLFLALDAPWGGTFLDGERLRVEEHPRLSLEGGWWSSRAAVLGPSGSVRPELACLRWLAQRRGERALLLLAREVEGGGEPPPALEGFPLMRLEEIEVEALAAEFPALLLERPASPEPRALRVAASGLGAEDPLFRKALQVLAAQGPHQGPILFSGLDPGGDPRALADALALLRAADAGRGLHVAWAAGARPSPLWQLEWTGQDPLGPSAGAPVLGQASAALAPWWEAGASWSRTPADRLMAALARGACCIDLGVVPSGSEASAFLAGALAWARRRSELLRSSRSLFPGESETLEPEEGWLARREGEVLLLVSGDPDGPPAVLLPQGRSWAAVLEVYPDHRILFPAPSERALPAGRGGVPRILHAWEAGARLPGWAAAWLAGGPPPAAELPPPAP